ncbi:cytochrome c3 family protein [candidate division KSB1 bacterium]
MRKKYIPIILVSVVFLYAVTVSVSESNWACGTCHTTEHDRWAVSTHNAVDCTQCHVDPGFGGAIDAQINGIGNLFTAVVSGNDIQPHEDPIPISTQNCMDCHASILRVNELGYEDTPDNTLKGQGLKISHNTHIDTYKMDCVECHRGIVHRDPEEIGKYKTNWPLMHKDCKPCHDGMYSERFKIVVTSLEEPDKCQVCHPYYEPPPEYDK